MTDEHADNSQYPTPATRWWYLRRLLRADVGATAVEYSLILAFIAAVIIGIVLLLGRQVQSEFSHMLALFQHP